MLPKVHISFVILLIQILLVLQAYLPSAFGISPGSEEIPETLPFQRTVRRGLVGRIVSPSPVASEINPISEKYTAEITESPQAQRTKTRSFFFGDNSPSPAASEIGTEQVPESPSVQRRVTPSRSFFGGPKCVIQRECHERPSNFYSQVMNIVTKSIIDPVVSYHILTFAKSMIFTDSLTKSKSIVGLLDRLLEAWKKGQQETLEVLKAARNNLKKRYSETCIKRSLDYQYTKKLFNKYESYTRRQIEYTEAKLADLRKPSQLENLRKRLEKSVLPSVREWFTIYVYLVPVFDVRIRLLDQLNAIERKAGGAVEVVHRSTMKGLNPWDSVQRGFMDQFVSLIMNLPTMLIRTATDKGRETVNLQAQQFYNWTTNLPSALYCSLQQWSPWQAKVKVEQETLEQAITEEKTAQKEGARPRRWFML